MHVNVMTRRTARSASTSARARPGCCPATRRTRRSAPRPARSASSSSASARRARWRSSSGTARTAPRSCTRSSCRSATSSTTCRRCSPRSTTTSRPAPVPQLRHAAPRQGLRPAAWTATIDVHTHYVPRGWPTCRAAGTLAVAARRVRARRDDHARRRRSSGASRPTAGTPTIRLADMDADGVDVQVVSPTPVFFSYEPRRRRRRQDRADLQRPRAGDLRAGARTGCCRSARCRCRTRTPRARSSTAAWPPGTSASRSATTSATATSTTRASSRSCSTAPRCGVPVFVHPWDMPSSPRLDRWMARWLTGMPAETHLSILAMILGGVFDRVDRVAADLLRARRRLVRVLARPDGQRLARRATT